MKKTFICATHATLTVVFGEVRNSHSSFNDYNGTSYDTALMISSGTAIQGSKADLSFSLLYKLLFYIGFSTSLVFKCSYLRKHSFWSKIRSMSCVSLTKITRIEIILKHMPLKEYVQRIWLVFPDKLHCVGIIASQIKLRIVVHTRWTDYSLGFFFFFF